MFCFCVILIGVPVFAAQVKFDGNKGYRAKWKINTYELALNANDKRGVIETRKIQYQGAYGVLPDIEREYYDLIGWFDAPEGGSQVSKDTKIGAGNTTIYAHWQARPIDVVCTDYTGTYDGQPHQASVTTKIPNVTFRFGTTNGSYNMDTMPSYTDAGSYTVYWQATHSDCLTTTGSVNVTIGKADATISLDASNGYIAVTSNSGGTISAVSSNTSVVNNVSIDGNAVKVLPTKYGGAGTVNITVTVAETKNYKAVSAVQSVTVSSRLIGNVGWWHPDNTYSFGYLTPNGTYQMDPDSMWHVTDDIPITESGFYYILGYSGQAPRFCLYNSAGGNNLYRALTTTDGYAVSISGTKYLRLSVCTGAGLTLNDCDLRKLTFN